MVEDEAGPGGDGDGRVPGVGALQSEAPEQAVGTEDGERRGAARRGREHHRAGALIGDQDDPAGQFQRLLVAAGRDQHGVAGLRGPHGVGDEAVGASAARADDVGPGGRVGHQGCCPCFGTGAGAGAGPGAGAGRGARYQAGSMLAR